MPSPFPGMDPYLENPEIFPDLHDSVITYLRETIQASLPAPYFAALGRRIWIEVSRRSIEPGVQIQRERAVAKSARPATTTRMAATSQLVPRPITVKIAHDEIREPFVEIYTRGDDGKRLVTSIEVLSLSNKTPGAQGRELYLCKQMKLLASKANLVEIDLLRAGEHVSAVPLDAIASACGEFDYHISVHCYENPETFFVYPIALEERLPPVAIPLLTGDAPVTLDLQAVFERCYDAGPYSREVRYGEDLIVPAPEPEQAAWVDGIMKAAQYSGHLAAFLYCSRRSFIP